MRMTHYRELENVRFNDELVPFDIAIKQAWLDKIEPGLLEAVQRDYEDLVKLRLWPAFRAVAEDPIKFDTIKPLYMATAGAPCSTKSTVLDHVLASMEDPRYAAMVLADPDRYTMEYMNHSYRPLLSAGEKARLGVEEASKIAYDRARPGSNVIANLLLNEAFDNRFSIAHGTTLTSPFIGGLLHKLGEAGYERKLLLCWGPDQMRLDAARHRIEKEAHYQVTPDDFVEKGKLFPQRMEDYFTHGDHLVLYWKADLETPSAAVAEYHNGSLKVHDPKGYGHYVSAYEQAIEALAKDGVALKDWSDLEDIYTSRHAPQREPSPRKALQFKL
jgi:hypothetical protein